jgi:hypothetical protein
MKSILSFLGVAVVLVACGGNVSVGGDGDSGTTPDGNVADGESADGATPDGGSADGAADAEQDARSCTDTPIARVCVRGDQFGGGETLVAGGTVRFEVYPKGCHSSSCTKRVEASCAVQKNEGNVITLGGKFCLGSTGDTVCTPDCGGGGVGSCNAAGVAAGQYSAKLGTLEVAFEVPSTLPSGGACASSSM